MQNAHRGMHAHNQEPFDLAMFEKAVDLFPIIGNYIAFFIDLDTWMLASPVARGIRFPGICFSQIKPAPLPTGCSIRGTWPVHS